MRGRGGHSRTIVVADDDGVGEADRDTDGDGDTDGEAVPTVLELMTRLSVAEADVPAVAVTTTWKVPDAAGVPLIVPAELIESPVGSPLAVHVAVPVPPVATTVAL
jgi:hypothetical protein